MTGCVLTADAKTIANALRLADGCIRDAKLLTASGSRNAAYLAEQALEQVIRAFATSEGMHIERSDAHQLDKVTRRFPDAHPEKRALASLVWLEAYATTFRYTMPSGQIPRAPDLQKLSTTIDAVAALISRAANHFEVDLTAEAKPAGNPTPQR